MGCVSSKFVAEEAQEKPDCTTISHVVSLTSTTYGALNLEKDRPSQNPEEEDEVKQQISSEQTLSEVKKSSPMRAELKKSSPIRDEPSEIINTWELMEGLEEEFVPPAAQSRWSPKTRLFDSRSPFKLINQIGSPRKAKKLGGKENKNCRAFRSLENSPKLVLKECNNNLKESLKKPSPRLWASVKGSPNIKRCDSLRIDSGAILSRKSLGPLFDPTVAKETSREEEGEEIKKIVLWKARNLEDSHTMLEAYTEKCPPGGQNSVVIYTTTLRGIRKTFEDCNIARSIIELQNVQMMERDVSMDSGYKEELRALMNSKEVRVPLVFVKGRLIGGAAEMVKLDEEGKLGILFDGIPKAAAACTGCAGVRFVMCTVCNGSCKLMGKDGKKSVRCGKCNENGLIQCPLCC